VTEVEALCRGFLQNAAARQAIVSRVGPEEPSADFLSGFGAGWEAGQVAALALALSVLTGESATALIEDAQSQAAVDSAFPFEVYFDEAITQAGVKAS
jgi:hypothetical protein